MSEHTGADPLEFFGVSVVSVQRTKVFTGLKFIFLTTAGVCLLIKGNI